MNVLTEFAKSRSFCAMLAFVLACGGFFVLEVPGRRSGLTSYAHGWPLVYLQREYSSDVTLLAEENHRPQDSTLDDSLFVTKIRPTWECSGLPWRLESRLSPWSLERATEFSMVRCVADLFFAGLVVTAIGWFFQRWRQHRGIRLQFRLRTLLIVIALSGVLFAQIKSWVVDRSADEETATTLLREIGSTKYQYASDPFGGIPPRDRGIVLDYGWNPPGWLPEWALKIGRFAELFRRVHGVSLYGDSNFDGPKIDNTTLQNAAKLRHVTSVTLSNVGVTDRGLAAFEQFEQLADLTIYGGRISDAGVAAISRLSKLQRLDIIGVEADDSTLAQLARLRELASLSINRQPNGPVEDDSSANQQSERSIHSAGIRQLKGLPHLKSLTLSGERFANDAFDALNDLSGLESLAVEASGGVLQEVPQQSKQRWNISLHGWRNLKELRLDSRPNSMSVALGEMPLLEQLAVIGDDHPPQLQTLTISNVPKLIYIDFSNMKIDDASWQAIRRSDRLEMISIDGFQEERNGVWQLDQFPSAASVEICCSIAPCVELVRMPNLAKVRFSYNEEAKSLRLDRLPGLAEVVLEGNPRLSEIHFAGCPNVRSIRLQFILERNDDKRGPQRVSIPGLAELASLDSFDGDAFPLTTQTLQSLGRLTALSTLTLNATSFDDHDLALLRKLVGLRELNLRSTSITDAGLLFLDGMTQLESLDLSASKVTAAGVGRLRQRFSNLKIEWRP